MKLFNARQIRQIEQETFHHPTRPVDPLDMMETAGRHFAERFREIYQYAESVTVFCGQGNNGGDGLVAARYLSDSFDVDVVIVEVGKPTPGFEANLQRLPAHGKLPIRRIRKGDDLTAFFAGFPRDSSGHVLIDAIFGLGLSRPIEGYWAQVIDHINALPSPVASLDMPSGMFADHLTTGAVIRADMTITFYGPKLGFFLPENEEYLGRWEYVDIGFAPDVVERTPTNYFLITPDDLPHIPARPVFSHKGTFGHALIVAGQYGMAGAALLATRAALRSGCGKVSVLSPRCNRTILQLGAPEALYLPANSDTKLTPMPVYTVVYGAIGIGPGIGKDPATAQFLQRMLDNKGPFVLDADALNILAENKSWLSSLPPDTILTPHLKEFERIAGMWNDGFHRLEKQQAFSIKHRVIVVYKTAYTTISMPDGSLYFNLTGNPGMAKGGTGDILTGFLTGLVARGLSPRDAALLGVYFHGAAGDQAAEKKGMEAMTAGDLLDYL